MKSIFKRKIQIGLWAFFLLSITTAHAGGIGCPGIGDGTVDSASLVLEGNSESACATIAPGVYKKVIFTAVNNRSVALKKYAITLSYDAVALRAGEDPANTLQISNLQTSPAAKTARINANKQTIKLGWMNVAAGTQLQASFFVYSAVIPTDIMYYKIMENKASYTEAVSKTTYSGWCNSFHIDIAYTGAVSGTVTSVSNGLPVSDVSVELTDSAGDLHTETTNSNGFYQHTGIAPGDFSVTFNKTGYISALSRRQSTKKQIRRLAHTCGPVVEQEATHAKADQNHGVGSSHCPFSFRL